MASPRLTCSESALPADSLCANPGAPLAEDPYAYDAQTDPALVPLGLLPTFAAMAH
eukprot:CAMPEP_0174857766 /NCGR_PEP_ID=MMETSP1114-20130205/40113_1 /TAXON_ID=312471 /ORGANISM="Neobodo designis, Strain CCAP 1951/1" /LENGTH=55 /DNA_ID=CAMNT_0016092635 /DNA_START=77 /DNA_END=241 /DNA_ORIENTATION=-